MNGRNRDSCHQLFKNPKILPLKSQYIFSLLLFVAKNRDLYESNSYIHNINIGFNFNLHTPTANLKTFQKWIVYFGIKFFNHLPTSVKNTFHDVNQFRPVLKSFLLIRSFTRRNILLGIPIEILPQCNHIKSKHQNNLITQYHSILLLLILNS
jgi:hypothetical protein